LKLEEVAILVGVSGQTINNWYRFKRENPDNEFVKLLPDYECHGGHGQRFWDKSDIGSLIMFKHSMPKGCKGIMGSVTQRYVRKEQ
jgi:hypothetical protein